MVTSHITDHYDNPEGVAEISRLYAGTTHGAVHRTFDEFVALLGDLELVPPGAVYATDWRPDSAEQLPPGARTGFWAAVGRVS
jgi:hypothetical protein